MSPQKTCDSLPKPDTPNKKAFELLRKVHELIPEGVYCYSGDYICPFWDCNEDAPAHETGYCHYLQAGDWYDDRLYPFLLWDQCKECRINEGDEE